MATDKYPINYHVLAEDFREQQAGTKAYNQGDGEWLHESLTTMCDAYDDLVDEEIRLRKEWRKADDGWIAAKAENERLLHIMAAALERTQVDDSGEATMVLEAEVNLDGTPKEKANG
jgi:hypothetical protein